MLSAGHMICKYTNTTSVYFLFFYALLLSRLLQYCFARDNITRANWLEDNNETLTSTGEKFQLGFFTPEGDTSKSRYMGIWYTIDPPTIVWVANRDAPLRDNTGNFTIAEDGNLLVYGKNRISYYNTSLDPVSSFNRTARLLDTGNLVLIDDNSGERQWQSFEHPTDTFLPGMKMDANLELTSWKAPNDPSSGNYTFTQDDEKDGSYVIKKKTELFWSSGGLHSFTKTGMYDCAADLLSNFSGAVQNIKKKSTPSHCSVGSTGNWDKMKLWMNSSGEIQYLRWDIDNKRWILIWSEPQEPCSIYNYCGNFGLCTSEGKPHCKCLTGFVPSSPDDWKAEQFSSGCFRSSQICTNKTGDTFLNLNMSKVGNPGSSFFFEFEAATEQNCKEECLGNCQCQAYSQRNATLLDARQAQRNGTRQGQGNATLNKCWIWTAELTDLHEGYADIGYILSFRVASSDSGGSNRNPTQSEDRQHRKASVSVKRVITFAVVTSIAILLCSIGYAFYRRTMTKRQESRERCRRNTMLHFSDSQRRLKDLMDPSEFTEDDKKGIDVPFFDFKSVLAATDNFSKENKLGQGGFGPVYKGKFPGGQEIAVKRLSSHSGQGLEEFKNEVVLIAKLQHRNLVRLLGYCTKGDEKILLYEYMPNKSLDAIIFDQIQCILLNWERRFDIIMGIARGLLYLHQDSRLRIIHRDLKTSNILLDDEMNPKISDFGLARIFGGRQTEASTNRVMGTYGYMSPEYALDGVFSIKSDVFSFGVVLLEIISGKRNKGSYQSQQGFNLLGYAWNLWKEERALDLLDQALVESNNRSEVLRCIIVGLLCVQEDPGDRPTMSNVVFMLGSEGANIPQAPKQPAFVGKKNSGNIPSSSSSKQESQSINTLTLSAAEGR